MTTNTCVTWTPCIYVDEVDFRIIVFTFNRAKSLLKLLKSIDDIELDGSKGALQIWIDRDKKGGVHNETVKAALHLSCDVDQLEFKYRKHRHGFMASG